MAIQKQQIQQQPPPGTQPPPILNTIQQMAGKPGLVGPPSTAPAGQPTGAPNAGPVGYTGSGQRKAEGVGGMTTPAVTQFAGGAQQVQMAPGMNMTGGANQQTQQQAPPPVPPPAPPPPAAQSGANAYGFTQTGRDPSAVTELNPFGWVSQANPGYAGVQGPGGANYFVQEQNAPGMQQAMGAGDQAGFFDQLDQDGSIPGFSQWDPQDDGTSNLTPWDGTVPGTEAIPGGGGIQGITPPGGAAGAGSGVIQQILRTLGGGAGTGTGTGGAGGDPGFQQGSTFANAAGGGPLPAFNQFGPGNDLRGTQINPHTDPRLATTQGQVDEATAGLTGPAQYDPETARARQLSAQALEQMMGGPNRADLAAQALALQDERSAESQQLAHRNMGSAAARYGRLGSGQVTTSIGDYGLARGRDRDRLQRELSLGAAEAELSDRGTRLSAGLQAGNAFQGQGLADLQGRMGVLGALSGVEDQQFGQGLTGRNELRGERGFQNQMQQQALGDAIQQIMLQENLTNSQFGREQSRINSLLGAGYGSDPTLALLGGSQNYANQAGQGGQDIGQLIAMLLQQQQQGGGTGQQVATDPYAGYA